MKSSFIGRYGKFLLLYRCKYYNIVTGCFQKVLIINLKVNWIAVMKREEETSRTSVQGPGMGNALRKSFMYVHIMLMKPDIRRVKILSFLAKYF